ncbi:reverse transcriptase domain-containing protein, partial [Tanacetum coccineum]
MTDLQSSENGSEGVREEAISIIPTGASICIDNLTNDTCSKEKLRNANHRDKHKSINGKKSEQAEQVWLGTIIGMVRGNTNKKRPRKQSEQWLDNEISFPYMPGCQLVDSPIILEALIEGFLVRRIYVDGGSSSQVIYKHCFQNLRAETKAKLKESRMPLVGFSGKTNKAGEPEDTIQPPPIPSKENTQTYEKDEEKDESLKKSIGSKPPEKVNTSSKHTPHIEPRVQRKRNIAPDRRKVVKDEVAEWLKAGIVRRIRYLTWVANSVLVKKPDNSWRMCIDFKDLNKTCSKDLYPLLVIDWKIEYLMGFKYKCFIDSYKGYHKIQMSKKDEEKTAFHTDKGVFWQMGRNLEAYVDDMVIKSKTELEMRKDVEETLLTHKKSESRESKGCSKHSLAEEPETNAAAKHIPSNEETNSRTADLNGSEEGRRTHGLPISGQQISQCQDWPSEELSLKPMASNMPPRSAIKGQVLADFLADTMAEDSSTQVKIDGPNDTLAEEESTGEQKAPKTKTSENLRIKTNIWKLYTDGASITDPVQAFEIPATIITDNKTQLINDPFKSWAEGLGIQLVSTSVYHPQANEAVERANRSIMQGIKTRLHQKGGAWVEELPNVLWAHKTTPKTSNGETPFSLAYGTKAVIPAEIGIPTRRTIRITFAMSTQQDIYAADSENRPPMLNKENYVPWLSRLLRYAKSRPNGKLIYNSIMNGPYVRRMIPEPGDVDREMEADDQAIQTILLGLPEDIYAAIDSCETAQEI